MSSSEKYSSLRARKKFSSDETSSGLLETGAAGTATVAGVSGTDGTGIISPAATPGTETGVVSIVRILEAGY